MSKPLTTPFLSGLLERTRQIVFVYDAVTNQFIYLNPSFESVWLKTRESVQANPASLMETIHPDDQTYVASTYRELLQGIEKKDVEFRIQLPNQSVRWICLTPFLFEQDPNQWVIAGFIEDITAPKQNHDTLTRFAAKKNSVLEILSHDLAGPLATIQGLTSLLASHPEIRENPELNNLITLITETSQRSIALIQEFVKQEFLESANVDLLKKRVDIVAKIREVIEQYKTSEQAIAKTFHFITPDDPVYIAIDEVKLMQVINNLISNAIKFTPDGGIITTTIQETASHVTITIADNGIGIPAHLQEGLFEKFTKARRPGLKGEPSTGLGMSISKTIVEWHGGRIRVESAENKGATFFMELPKTDA